LLGSENLTDLRARFVHDLAEPGHGPPQNRISNRLGALEDCLDLGSLFLRQIESVELRREQAAALKPGWAPGNLRSSARRQPGMFDGDPGESPGHEGEPQQKEPLETKPSE
jgi:hypothetical protein